MTTCDLSRTGQALDCEVVSATHSVLCNKDYWGLSVWITKYDLSTTAHCSLSIRSQVLVIRSLSTSCTRSLSTGYPVASIDYSIRLNGFELRTAPHDLPVPASRTSALSSSICFTNTMYCPVCNIHYTLSSIHGQLFCMRYQLAPINSLQNVTCQVRIIGGWLLSLWYTLRNEIINDKQ